MQECFPPFWSVSSSRSQKKVSRILDVPLLPDADRKLEKKFTKLALLDTDDTKGEPVIWRWVRSGLALSPQSPEEAAALITASLQEKRNESVFSPTSDGGIMPLKELCQEGEVEPCPAQGDGRDPASSSDGGDSASGTEDTRRSTDASNTESSPEDRLSTGGEEDSPAPSSSEEEDGSGESSSQPSSSFLAPRDVVVPRSFEPSQPSSCFLPLRGVAPPTSSSFLPHRRWRVVAPQGVRIRAVPSIDVGANNKVLAHRNRNEILEALSFSDDRQWIEVALREEEAVLSSEEAASSVSTTKETRYFFKLCSM